jgi:FKBP-type peptidyl-prolyl cis-trans isomerase (trigger factor)
MILFDAGTLHAGRAPSRACPVLRVTVAYKLDRATSSTPAKAPQQEVSATGSKHVHSIRFPAAVVDAAVAERLEKLSHSVSFPGFRAGHVPANVLQARYGAQSRRDVVNQMASQAVDRALPKGSVASSVELKSGADTGDVELELTAVHLPDLPAIDFSGMVLERLTADDAAIESSGSMREQAEAHFRGYLKAQVLDRMDSIYRFPILPGLIDQEFSRIWKAAQAEVDIPANEKTETSNQFRAIAERRLRLGLVVAELGRRHEIQAGQPAELEDKVIDHIVAQVQVEERAVSGAELREMLQS